MLNKLEDVEIINRLECDNIHERNLDQVKVRDGSICGLSQIGTAAVALCNVYRTAVTRHSIVRQTYYSLAIWNESCDVSCFRCKASGGVHQHQHKGQGRAQLHPGVHPGERVLPEQCVMGGVMGGLEHLSAQVWVNDI